MGITINQSARGHLITDAEIHAVLGFPVLRVVLAPRRAGALPVLFLGPAAENQPWIEVIADFAGYPEVEVFHAMMLRPSVVAALGLNELIDPDYAPQRA